MLFSLNLNYVRRYGTVPVRIRRTHLTPQLRTDGTVPVRSCLREGVPCRHGSHRIVHRHTYVVLTLLLSQRLVHVRHRRLVVDDTSTGTVPVRTVRYRTGYRTVRRRFFHDKDRLFDRNPDQSCRLNHCRTEGKRPSSISL